ncbi:MAG: phosphatidate cytidylyltransferase [Candidatus Hydrogenedentes bacterium]|nr:phosphatidate cytidylyltransferase [Candidatus Hydrogenedentota bacterium]
MSPTAALHSTVFQIYVAITLGLLVFAGLAIAILKWGFKKDMTHPWASYRGWLIMIPLLLLCIFLGRIPTIVFFTAVAVFGFKEFARATGLYEDWGMTGAVYLGIIGVGIVSVVPNPRLDVPGWYGLFSIFPAYVIALILLIPILRNRVKGQLQAIALAVVGFVYIGWMFGHVIFLSNSTHAYGYLMYLLFAVEVNDVAAYTCGKAFGKHPLRSEISPKKTWEGALGALAVSMALPWVLHFSFPHFGVLECILTGLIVGIGGQLGDLSISVIKRDLHIKDMGALMSGHGGILDRLDSLIYVAPLFFHMVRFFHDIY